MFKTGVTRGSITSPILQKSARFQIWTRADNGEDSDEIKKNSPLMSNGKATKESNIDIEYAQRQTWLNMKD